MRIWLKHNIDIRVECVRNDVYLKDIAEKMDMNAQAFYHRLRKTELSDVERVKVFQAIQDLSNNVEMPKTAKILQGII